MDYPGTTVTGLNGINDAGMIVGNWGGAMGKTYTFKGIPRAPRRGADWSGEAVRSLECATPEFEETSLNCEISSYANAEL